MSAIEIPLWVRLLPHTYASHASVPQPSSQIVGVTICVVGLTDSAEYGSRFDLGKCIFLDDIPGVDRGGIAKRHRTALARAIANYIAGTAPFQQPVESVQDLRAENTLLRAVVDALPRCMRAGCERMALWDFTRDGGLMYCQEHAEANAGAYGHHLYSWADRLSWADAVEAWEAAR